MYRFHNGEIQVRLPDIGWVISGHNDTSQEHFLLQKKHYPNKALVQAFEQKFATEDPNGRR